MRDLTSSARGASHKGWPVALAGFRHVGVGHVGLATAHTAPFVRRGFADAFPGTAL